MKILPESPAAVAQAVKALENGGLVVYPTETVYGVGVDATNPTAVRKLGEYKTRPLGKPYSIAVADKEMAEEYVILNKTARNLYKNFLPGPLTVISTGKHKVAPGVESESGTLGVRIPDYPLVLKIIKKLGRPITATSANRSYEKRPYKISDLNLEKFDLVIDAGELPHREPSTVVDTTMDDVVTLRAGDIVVGGQLAVGSYGPENTMNTAKELWQKYEKLAGQRAVVFALMGEMGAGKTVFVKGLGKAMGIPEEITSPTFILNDQYTNPKSQIVLEHIDTWRMQTPDELGQLGLAGMISDKSVIAIEWADRAAEIIRKYNQEAVVVWVKIEYGKGIDERLISWKAV